MMAMMMMVSCLVDFRQILERFAVKRKPALYNNWGAFLGGEFVRLSFPFIFFRFYVCSFYSLNLFTCSFFMFTGSRFVINCLFIYILHSYCYVIGVNVCLSHVFVCLFTIFTEFRYGLVSVYLCSLFISFQVCLLSKFAYFFTSFISFVCIFLFTYFHLSEIKFKSEHMYNVRDPLLST